MTARIFLKPCYLVPPGSQAPKEVFEAILYIRWPNGKYAMATNLGLVDENMNFLEDA